MQSRMIVALESSLNENLVFLGDVDDESSQVLRMDPKRCFKGDSD